MSESWQVPDFLRSILGYGTVSPLTGSVPLYDYEAARRQRVAKTEAPEALLSRLGIDENTVAEQTALIEAEDVAKKAPVRFLSQADRDLKKLLYGEKPEDLLRRIGSNEKPVAEQAALIEAEDALIEAEGNDIRSLVANKSTNAINEGARAAAKANIRKRENLLSQAMDKVKEDEITVARSLLGDGPVTSGIDTLLGKVDWGNLLSIIGNPAFSAALMQPGISPMQAIVGGIGAARESQAAAASAEREARLKEYEAQTKRIDAQGATPPKLTSEVAKLYDQMEAATKMTETAQNVRITLGDSDSEWSTGGPGKLAKTLRAFGAFFGQDPGEMSADELTRELAKAKTAVLGTKIFGREANKQELEILKELVSENDWWTSRSQILNAVNALAKEAETRRFNLANRARAFGLPLAHTEMRIPDYPFKRLGSSSGNVLPS